jgi:succinate dehydrogenase / fumarate reductase cytochrome b subunit
MADASPRARARPLSPHLLHWRWHVTMAASILNRATGVGLYIGWLVLAGWALALASGADAYGAYAGLLTSIPGQIVLFAIALSLFFHLAAGVRHLFWDFGKGFTPKTADVTALIALAFAVVATVVLFVVVYASTGAAA